MRKESWNVERRSDGALIVRVICERDGKAVPDAVFTFRVGDPQYTTWERRLNEAHN